jgi:ubiquinone/menaquinone biosynthesis C-methylase UbiE
MLLRVGERRGPDIHDRSDLNIRSGPQMREYEAIARRIAADSPGHVLDWGCGRGQMTWLLREQGLRVTAYDYRPSLDRPIRKTLEFEGVEADLSPDPVRVPYAADSFDAVLSCGVLEHVLDPDESLEELRRVLRPGGLFYVYKLPNKFSYLEWIARRIGIYHHGQNPLDQLYTDATASELLHRHGFRVIQRRRANLLPLTIVSKESQRLTAAIWGLNRVLSRVPVLNKLSTNLELVAQAPK